MGRKTKLTKQIQSKIIKYIKQGNTYEIAALSAGVSRSTFYNWLSWGEVVEGEPEPDPIYIDFREAVEEAAALAEMERVKTILDAAKGTGRYKGVADWKAAAWFLERRSPEAWGRRQAITADINHSGEVTERHEYDIKQTIEIDDEAKEHAKQLFRRTTAIKNME